MKPSESFLLFTIFAANSISIADENSAAANSFRTKQYLSGSNFLKLFFGIKNILVLILIYLILFAPKANAKSCLSFLPYGFNESYVHLPLNVSFCVKQGKIINKYQTDNYGGRLLYNEAFSNKIQVFGDSQVLGLDIENVEQHYLNALYKKIILSYNFGGVQNQLEGLDSFYKIKPFDHNELINKINYAINLDSDTKNNMGEVARQHIIDNFSKEIMLKSYINFYLEL